jgi:hypothetical protein
MMRVVVSNNFFIGLSLMLLSLTFIWRKNMRRTASEIIHDLEIRIARLERKSSTYKFPVRNQYTPDQGVGFSGVDRMNLPKLLERVEHIQSRHGGRCRVDFTFAGKRSSVHFICGDSLLIVNMADMINAIKKDHPTEWEDLMSEHDEGWGGFYNDPENKNVLIDRAEALREWMKISSGSFGGGLGREWDV